MNIMNDLSSLTLELYRRCRNEQPTHLSHWIFNELKKRINFDSALWHTKTLGNKEMNITFIHSVDPTGGSLNEYAQIHHLDHLVHTATKKPGSAITGKTCSNEASPAFIACAEKWHLQYELTICLHDVNTASLYYVTMWRHDTPFLENELRFLEIVLPHLHEARTTNQINDLIQTWPKKTNNTFATAISDNLNCLHTPCGDFIRLLNLEWPNWQGPELPPPVAYTISLVKHGQPNKYTGSRISIHATPIQGSQFLRARLRQPIDNLTPREFEIGRAAASGKTHKEIAQKLNLAPSTVRNHLASILAKLNVSKQAEMAAQLASFDC